MCEDFVLDRGQASLLQDGGALVGARLAREDVLTNTADHNE
jgi:hypothetical protein